MGKPSQLRRRIQRENYVGAASNWSISIYLMWEHLKLKSIHFFQSCFQCLSNLSGCLKSKCVVYHLFTFTTSYLFVLKIVGQEEMLVWYSGRILFLCTTFVLIIMTSKHFWLHQCIWLQTYLCSQSSCDHIWWFQWLQLAIHHRYVILIWCHVLWSSQKCLEVMIISPNVMHKSSVRPLYNI